MAVEKDIAVAYWLQLSFYLHSVYGTLYMDAWRKDSIVMLIHHFITMALIGFSYGMRYVISQLPYTINRLITALCSGSAGFMILRYVVILLSSVVCILFVVY